MWKVLSLFPDTTGCGTDCHDSHRASAGVAPFFFFNVYVGIIDATVISRPVRNYLLSLLRSHSHDLKISEHILQE